MSESRIDSTSRRSRDRSIESSIRSGARSDAAAIADQGSPKRSPAAPHHASHRVRRMVGGRADARVVRALRVRAEPTMERRATRRVLKPLAVQYVDFARWQSQAARGPAMQESLAWWHDRLEGAPPLLALPTDRPRPPRPTFSAGAETFIIPGELVDRLKGIARGERATLFMTLLAGFQTMLHRYTGSDDIVVGAFIAGRTRAETEGLIGLFSNTLAMRGDLTGDPTFRELLRKTRDFAFEAYGRQDVPFDMLVESIHPERNLSYQPIVQVTFQVRNYPLEDTQLAGLAVEEVDFDPGVAPLRPELRSYRESGRAVLQAHLQSRSFRPRNDHAHGGALRNAARRHRRRPGQTDLAAADVDRRGAPSVAGRMERHSPRLSA